MSAASPSQYEQTVMEAEAAAQQMEVHGGSALACVYRERISRERLIDAARVAALEGERNRNMTIAHGFVEGFDGIPEALADIESADRLRATASLQHKDEGELLEQESAEDEQADREFRLYSAGRTRPTSPPVMHAASVSQADLRVIQDLFDAARRDNVTDEMSPEEERSLLVEKMAMLERAMPVLQQVVETDPTLASDPLDSALNALLQSAPGMIAAARLRPPPTSSQRSILSDARISAGDWARYVVQTEGLGPETLIGISRGLTRPVDARDPSDWMSLLWEVAVSAPFSSIIRHDVSRGTQELISELDVASEIFALSYRHRVHGDQSNGLRYRLPECCWADLRQVVEAAVTARPHGRVVLWWDQVLGATADVESNGIAWATVGLLPYIVFRVVYNPPTRCQKHKPVYHGRADFENPTDDQDIHRLWVNLEHRLALRGRGLLMSRRAGADGCDLWNLQRAGPAWEGPMNREIRGENCVPMVGMRKIVSYLLREEVGNREVTFPEDVDKLQRWGATLARLPRKDWPLFLAGHKTPERQELTVEDVIRMILRAGAPTTLDGDGPLLPSAPTVESPRLSEHRRWSGVSEWAPLLMERALAGWLRADVEREARRELERFTIWLVFPVETDAQISEAVAIGKLWTPVQAVSAYMLVWLGLPVGFEHWKAQETLPDNLATGTSLYANGLVRKTQLVWPNKVKQFHETFCGVHWSLLSLKTCEHKGEYPLGLCAVRDVPEPQANRALPSPQVEAERLFSSMVEEWGTAITQHLVGNPVVLPSDKSGLRPFPGVPIGVMSGEKVCWGKE